MGGALGEEAALVEEGEEGGGEELAWEMWGRCGECGGDMGEIWEEGRGAERAAAQRRVEGGDHLVRGRVRVKVIPKPSPNSSCLLQVPRADPKPKPN